MLKFIHVVLVSLVFVIPSCASKNTKKLLMKVSSVGVSGDVLSIYIGEDEGRGPDIEDRLSIEVWAVGNGRSVSDAEMVIDQAVLSMKMRAPLDGLSIPLISGCVFEVGNGDKFYRFDNIKKIEVVANGDIQGGEWHMSSSQE